MNTRKRLFADVVVYILLAAFVFVCSTLYSGKASATGYEHDHETSNPNDHRKKKEKKILIPVLLVAGAGWCFLKCGEKKTIKDPDPLTLSPKKEEIFTVRPAQ